jgi:hypothetical protein
MEVVRPLVGVVAVPAGGEPYWDIVANILSQYDSLDAQQISAYTAMSLASSLLYELLGFTTPMDIFLGTYMLQSLYPGNTSNSLLAALTTVFDAATADYPGQFTCIMRQPTVYPDFWEFYISPGHNELIGAGVDQVLGSRLLDEKALLQNLTALKDALKIVTQPSVQLSLVAGRGVANAKRRGGSNSANLIWRKALVETSKLCNIGSAVSRTCM